MASCHNLWQHDGDKDPNWIFVRFRDSLGRTSAQQLRLVQDRYAEVSDKHTNLYFRAENGDRRLEATSFVKAGLGNAAVEPPLLPLLRKEPFLQCWLLRD